MPTPQVTSGEQQGAWGELHVNKILSDWGHLVVPVEGYADRGIDFVVIPVHDGRVTTLQFNVQVKTKAYSDDDHRHDIFPPRILAKHVEFWRELNVPTVLVCVDTGESPPGAYWRAIDPDDSIDDIRMTRQKVLGPGSRDEVLTQIKTIIRKIEGRTIGAGTGQLLSVPVNLATRAVAKRYYRENLMSQPHQHPMFGPIEFTWKGWRYITRRGVRSQHITSSLSLLPCVRSVLAPSLHPTGSRRLPAIARGDVTLHRTLLSFERELNFTHRAPAMVRVVIERKMSVPADWQQSPPRDPRRWTQARFLSVRELGQ